MDLVQDGERPVSLCCDAVSGQQAEVELNYMLPILLNMRKYICPGVGTMGAVGDVAPMKIGREGSAPRSSIQDVPR